jgi:hypothetical protein
MLALLVITRNKTQWLRVRGCRLLRNILVTQALYEPAHEHRVCGHRNQASIGYSLSSI